MRLWTSILLSAGLISATSGAFAAPDPCRRDHRLDVPGKILNVSAVSSRMLAYKVQLPSDSSGRWTYNFQIRDITQPTWSATYSGQVSSENPSPDYEVILADKTQALMDGLLPSTDYDVSMHSADGCGNRFISAPVRIKTPADPLQSAAPSMTDVTQKLVTSGSGSFYLMRTCASSGTGVDFAEIYVDGALLGRSKYGSGIPNQINNLGNFVNIYPIGGCQVYYMSLTYDIRPSKGQHLVEMRVFDVLGNFAAKSAVMDFK